MYHNILQYTSHRSEPIPKGPWVMTQKWNDVLFMHLPIEKSKLENMIPEGLEIDTFDGEAWITIIPFKITNMRFRMTPFLPFVHSFLELNVRTYVKRNGKQGIYFFSLDADSLPAVIGARIGTLPYYFADMMMKKTRNVIHFKSVRNLRNDKVFMGSYQAASEAYYPPRTGLTHWLVERYYLWSEKNGSLYRGDIHHKPWEVSNAEVMVMEENIMPDTLEGQVVKTPIFHYASEKHVLFWPFKKIK